MLRPGLDRGATEIRPVLALNRARISDPGACSRRPCVDRGVWRRRLIIRRARWWSLACCAFSIRAGKQGKAYGAILDRQHNATWFDLRHRPSSDLVAEARADRLVAPRGADQGLGLVAVTHDCQEDDIWGRRWWRRCGDLDWRWSRPGRGATMRRKQRPIASVGEQIKG